MSFIEIEIANDLAGIGTATGDLGDCVPVNTYYEDNRTQMIILASQLIQMGLQAGDDLQEIGFYPTQTTGRTMENVRFYVGHTALSTISAWIDYSAMTSVFGPTNVTAYTPLNQYHPHVLATSFVWNGTSNLVFDFSRDNDAWTDGGAQRYTTGLTNGNVSIYQRADGQTFPYAPTTVNSSQNILDLYLKFERADVVNKNKNLLISANF